nr:MAG TPA: Preneck appendage protein [Caudoviricetes sp.]
MTTTTDLPMKQIVFNNVSSSQYQEMLENGTLKDDEFYITPDDVQEITNNIGQVVSFVCSNDWTPEGCLPCDGKEYEKAAFENLWNNYLATGILNTCTYSDYQASLTTYGSCAKFGLDADNGKFRVPLIKDGSYITQALTNSENGKCYNESLPNIKGETNSWSTGGFLEESSIQNGVFYKGKSTAGHTSGISGLGYVLNFDASRSSSTYQDGAKVQGDNVRLRFFVVVAKGIQYNSSINWSKVWSTKADDSAVIHNSGDETITGTKTFTSTIQGTAYRALWGDLAENYLTDQEYPIGTLIEFGGDCEATIAKNEANGVISDKPAFVLNASSNGQPIALSGKVPVRVLGKVCKGDKLILSSTNGVAIVRPKSSRKKVIAIALENNDSDNDKLVMCVTKLSF